MGLILKVFRIFQVNSPIHIVPVEQNESLIPDLVNNLPAPRIRPDIDFSVLEIHIQIKLLRISLNFLLFHFVKEIDANREKRDCAGHEPERPVSGVPYGAAQPE